MVHVVDLLNEPVHGAFYPTEIQSVDFQAGDKTVQHVFQTRRRGRSLEYLVSFAEYPPTFKAWITTKDM